MNGATYEKITCTIWRLQKDIENNAQIKLFECLEQQSRMEQLGMKIEKNRICLV